ncbi:MAG: ATP-binding protein [Anaerolineae bacterium]|jgi:PAS domain S-box-containing protein|nr:ATP-binding protein [Anaerolineae bacterium]
MKGKSANSEDHFEKPRDAKPSGHSADETVKQFSFLYEAARALNTTLDLNEILQQLMNLTRQHFRPDAVSVALVEPNGTLLFKAASGKAAQRIKETRLAPGTGIVGWVAIHGEPVWISDVNADPRFYPGTDQKTGFVTRSIYAVPVQYGDYTMAVLEMINPPAALELAEIQEIMKALAALAAPAIRNAALFKKVSEAEARYQQLFNTNIDPIAIIDGEGHILELNQAAQKLLALAKETPSQPDLSTLGLTPEQFVEFKALLKKDQVVSWEAVLGTSKDEPYTLEIHLTQVQDYTADAAYQWLAHDITDRTALETMREQLSHMIVHDLRTPLGNITNSLELIRNAWADKDSTMPVDQVVRIALRSAQRMERLISNILDLARLRTQEKTLTMSEVNINALAQEVAEISEPSLLHRHQTFIAHVPEDLPTLSGDAELLRRVLTNLLDNAIKFTPNRGIIELTISYNDEEFQFAVSDNGPGIAPEDLEHLFEIYVRGRNVGSIKGTGVGLAFCKLVIEAHGGRIWVKSIPTEGTIFIFTLPRHRHDTTPPPTLHQGAA